MILILYKKAQVSFYIPFIILDISSWPASNKLSAESPEKGKEIVNFKYWNLVNITLRERKPSTAS